MTDPHRRQPARDGDAYVEQCGLQIAGLHKSQCLETESGKRGVSPANSDHHELPLPRAREQPAVGTRQRGIKPDDEGARHIDEQCAPGKPISELAREQNRNQKARHAAAYGAPSKDAADYVKKGSVEALSFPDFFPNQGGLPIKVDGHTIGGIAASGAKSEIDEAISQAALDAALTPESYLGAAGAFVDAAIAEYGAG